MKTSVPVLAVLAFLAASGTALADDDDCIVPMAQWQPRAAVQRMAMEHGWTVARIRIDDGCYEIIGRDAQGRQIEVKIDPGTLAIIASEFED